MGVSPFSEFVEQVRKVSDIADVIGKDVELSSCGSTLKGLSPFRHETNPSFTVWPETQSWCDFSGNGRAGGDVFAYIQEKHGIGFKEAVYILAENAGIKPPNQDQATFEAEVGLLEERREIEKLLTKAAAFYHARLPTKIRQDLLKSHYGFSDQTIDDLLLGWADGCLLDHLANEGISEKLALKTGLFVITKDGAKDFFRNRIVFPYWKRGQVVYFIARSTMVTWDEKWEQGKYKKQLTKAEKRPYVSSTVQNDYFYNEDAASGRESLLITEGVTDCISAMQAGIPCISPVTTRFRKRDIEKLTKLTRTATRIVICNDNESNGAGANGAIDTAEALFKVGRDVYIATIPLPEGKDKIDVNELIVTQGNDALSAVLADAKHLIDHLIEGVPQNTDGNDLAAKLEPILTLLVNRNPLSRENALVKISKRFMVTKGVLNDYLKQIARKIREKKSEVSSSLPMVQTNDRQLIAIVGEAAEVLVETNRRHTADVAAGVQVQNDIPLVFCRCGSFVQIVQPRNKPIHIAEVDQNMAYAILTRIATWFHCSEGDKHYPVFPPREVARDIVTLVPTKLPELDAVITTPVFGAVGNLIERPGYDETDNVWLQPLKGFDLPDVPEIPTQSQIDDAKALFLEDLFVDFPFVSPGDRTGIFAAMLLPFIRRMINGPTPIHLVEAPKAGSGKSLLCDLVSVVATGAVCDSQTLPQNEEETRKKITAELSKARPIILLDNAKERRCVDSSALASVATSENWTDRVLGETRMITLSNRALWFLTGNNPVLSNELTRRSIRIRLDSKQDMPWRRDNFKHKNIIRWARENRTRLVQAALTLIQAWIAESKPEGEKCLGSFEHWSAVMDGVFQVVGIDGFLDNLEEFYAEADTESEMWREFTEVWWNTYQNTPKSMTELNVLCEQHDLLQTIRGDGNERSQQIRLSKALKNARDRVYGELQISTNNDVHLKKKFYALKKLSQGSDDSLPTGETNGAGIDPFI